MPSASPIPTILRHRNILRALSSVVPLMCLGCTIGSGSASAPRATTTMTTTPDSVQLSASQLQSVKISPAAVRNFALQLSSVGSIDFDEDAAVQVFSPYQGRIIHAFAQVGDQVARGKTLYTIDSPDLMQAESNLIAAAGVADLTAAALARAKDLYETQGIAQKDYQQAISDQMTAEGSLNAAREAVRVFGKSESEINSIVAQRNIDPALVVASPVSGRVTARFAQPGLLVQPGNVPAPYSVADISIMWMLADVPESDVALIRVGQSVTVKVMALGDRRFSARISTIGATVDPNTHTVVVRSEVPDPEHALRPGMIATFVIQTGAPVESIAVPMDGVVREGDGTMSVWVTTDRHRFTRRIVRIGLQQDGFDQVAEGLQPGELIVTEGAILLSNMLYGGGGDS
jgi:membrane fusion protein, heavy metal efflux system